MSHISADVDYVKIDAHVEAIDPAAATKTVAFVDYVNISAVVKSVQPALKIVAHVIPRIRAFIESDEIVAMVGESRYVITYSVWDAGLSEWDVENGVTRSRWDTQLR